MKYNIKPGDKFNRWTVLEIEVYNPDSKAKQPIKMAKCQCDCGTIRYKEYRSLINGTSKSCGCLRTEQLIERNIQKGIIPIGTKYGHLTVIEDLGLRQQKRGRRARWSKCRCDCGTIIEVLNNNLKSGGSQSCGCVKSRGETIIRQILIENNIKFSVQYTFPDLVGKNGNYYRFDFAIFNNDNQLIELIEFDGRQHYTGGEAKWETRENLEAIKQRDQIKNDYCKNHNIKLIRIPYFEIKDINLTKLGLEKYCEENNIIEKEHINIFNKIQQL